MNKKNLFITTILLLFASVSQASFTVDTIVVDVTAGDVFMLNYTVTTGEHGTINISVYPDAVGFNITYEPFFIAPCVIPVCFKTDPMLMPGEYIITATIVTEHEAQVTRHSSHHVVVQHPVEPLMEDVDEPDDDDDVVNETEPAVPAPDDMTQDEDDSSIIYLLFYFGFALFIISVLILYLHRGNKSKR